MTRALFDSDVLLDVLLRREPHLSASAAALDLAARESVDGYVSAHAVTTLAYLLQREFGAAGSRRVLSDLLAHLRVAPVTDAIVRGALTSRMHDFEDAVCSAAAEDVDARVIVTRNVADFTHSTVPAVLPIAFLASELAGEATD